MPKKKKKPAAPDGEAADQAPPPTTIDVEGAPVAAASPPEPELVEESAGGEDVEALKAKLEAAERENAALKDQLSEPQPFPNVLRFTCSRKWKAEQRCLKAVEVAWLFFVMLFLLVGGVMTRRREDALSSGQMTMDDDERNVQVRMVRIAVGCDCGVLEMNIDGGGWGAVCDGPRVEGVGGFDRNDNGANAFCREFGYASGTPFDTTHGDDTFAADAIVCEADASGISQCSSSESPYLDDGDCFDIETVGICCTADGDDPLADPTSSAECASGGASRDAELLYIVLILVVLLTCSAGFAFGAESGGNWYNCKCAAPFSSSSGSQEAAAVHTVHRSKGSRVACFCEVFVPTGVVFALLLWDLGMIGSSVATNDGESQAEAVFHNWLILLSLIVVMGGLRYLVWWRAKRSYNKIENSEAAQTANPLYSYSGSNGSTPEPEPEPEAVAAG